MPANIIVQIIIAIVISVITKVVASAMQSDPTTVVRRRGVLSNTVSTQETLPLIYGKHRIGVNWVDISLAGNDNQYLYGITTLGEGEINGLVQVDGVDQIFLNDKIWTEFQTSGSNLFKISKYYNFDYELFNGAADQALCVNYAAKKSGWDSALRYTAYLFTTFQFSDTLFQSRPEVTALIEGLKIYNPVTEVTEYSNNAALCTYDFLTRSSRRGGMGIASSRIDTDSVIAAAAYCAAKGWTCDIVLKDDVPALEHLGMMLNTFRGSLIRSGTKFKLTYRDLDYEASVMDLSEDDVMESAGKSTLRITQPSIFDTPNAVKMTYYNEEKEYAQDELVVSDEDALEADGWDYREKEISMQGFTNVSNVQKMANYFLERLRINKTIFFVGSRKCVMLEPEDLVTLTHSRPGWDKKMMRLTESAISQVEGVSLSSIEEDEIFYDDTYNPQDHKTYDTNLPSPSDTIPTVINVVNSEEVYTYRGRSFTRWQIDFDPPLTSQYPWWDHGDIYIKIGVDGDWKYQTTAKSNFVLDPVEEGKQYFCKIVSVSIWGSKQPFEDGYTISKNIVGKTTIPADVTGFTAVAHGDTVTLLADKLADDDIFGYEVRLGDNWDNGLFVGFNETPNIRLAGVRPSPSGSPHVFWIKAMDNAGNYSENAAYASATVFYPANYTDKNTWTWDFTSAPAGTFTNTQYSSGGCICSHTDNVLVGTWLSPEYDLGSTKTVRIWGDFLTSLVNGGNTWDDIIPDGATWDDVIGDITYWRELLTPAVTGKITAKLKWGNTSGNLNNEVSGFEILSPEINGRYVQAEITITDPNITTSIKLLTLHMKAAYWS